MSRSRRGRAALAVCIATLGTGAAGTGAAVAAPIIIRPFQSVELATADNGETALVWRTRTGGMHAAIGTPGSPFTAPITLADGGSATTGPSLGMDAAGNVVVAWETYVLGGCDKYGSCRPSSLGVFVALRPAGGAFGAPVRLAQAQPGMSAVPRLAMNRAGDWVLAMNVGTTTVVGAGRGATPPSALIALPMATLHQFALDETGAATFAGVDGAQRPATVVRKPDGSFAAPQLLDGPSTAGLGVRLGVGPRGDALAVWPAGSELHWASRPPGGSFGAAGALPPRSPSPVAVVAVGVDATGRTTTVLPASGPIAATSPLVLLRGTTAAPFAEAVTLTEPGHQLVAAPTFALGADGTAAVAWLDSERSSTSVRLSVAFGDRSFSPSLGLGDSTVGTRAAFARRRRQRPCRRRVAGDRKRGRVAARRGDNLLAGRLGGIEHRRAGTAGSHADAAAAGPRDRAPGPAAEDPRRPHRPPATAVRVGVTVPRRAADRRAGHRGQKHPARHAPLRAAHRQRSHRHGARDARRPPRRAAPLAARDDDRPDDASTADPG